MKLINKFLDGKKTLIAAIGAGAAVIVVITQSLLDGFDLITDGKVILDQLIIFMGIVGLGHKAEKILDQLKK